MTLPLRQSEVGHVPSGGVCKACGLRSPDFPHEPCPEQKFARALVEAGYLALPESPEAFTALVRAATDA
jgi:hypothetical protein